ncbi:hypothetical protein SVAN01_10337 [Stagonosporopsis vannaccii]|nr:hypothetical protein SVAN01_10337 [Stagonosporopsis vannaccii]
MAQYPNEAPPEYSISDPQPKSPKWIWWSRKRVWVPTLLIIVLVLFGIIFGAVYGVKQSQLENAERDRDQLLAAMNWTSSASSSRGYYPTGTSSYYPYPTPAPADPSAPLLTAQGNVPRDISAAAEAPQLLVWNLRDEGRLWKSESGSSESWEVYHGRRFLFAPVSVGTGDFRARNLKQTAVSVDAISGRIVYMHYHDGQWGDWQELEFAAQFLRRPAVISRAQDRVDILNVDREGHLWIVSYDGSSWSEWTELGTDISGEVSATSWGEDRIDVFAKNGEVVIHKYWNVDPGWAEDWYDLGDPSGGWFSEVRDERGSPLAASWRNGDDGVIDVFMTRGTSQHKIFQHGEWSDWLIVSASHEGGEFVNTQSIVQGRGGENKPRAHIISRGTDNCIHYIAHNGTDWGWWDYLWCNKDNVGNELYYPTEFMPTSMVAMENGNLELVVKNLLGDVLRQLLFTPVDDDRLWNNDDWTSMGQPL